MDARYRIDNTHEYRPRIGRLGVTSDALPKSVSLLRTRTGLLCSSLLPTASSLLPSTSSLLSSASGLLPGTGCRCCIVLLRRGCWRTYRDRRHRWKSYD
jgi:hypothetical protein